MSKANVAQEPSMDEILASIRRIIETGEDRNGAPNGAGLSSPRLQRAPYGLGATQTFSQVALPAGRDPMDFSEAARIGRSSGSADMGSGPTSIDRSDDDDDRLTAALETELAASWGSFEPPASAASATTQAPTSVFGEAPRPASAEPVSVEERPLDIEVTAPAELREWEPEASPQLEDEAPEDAPSVSVESPVPASEGARYEEQTLQDQSAMGTEPAMSDRSVFEPANTDERERRAGSAPDPTFYAPIHDASAAPLTSDMTGHLVAASFDELAQAIRNGELKSLESMAQEMLRPMLQEWLDDNLPRMVERLVREEIERMARGGRR